MKMFKREERKDDGRYIIFYEFNEENTLKEENIKNNDSKESTENGTSNN